MMTEMIELAGQIGMAGKSTLTVARRPTTAGDRAISTPYMHK